MADKFANPFSEFRGSDRSPRWVYEKLSDQIWHRTTSIRNEMKVVGLAHLTNALERIQNEGTRPMPKYPAGRWTMHRRLGEVRISFNEQVEVGEKIDQELVKELVGEAMQKQMAAVIEIATKEHKQLLENQIEELKKSSVPILELHRYETSNKKVVKKIEPAHEMIQYLLYLLQQGEHVYLYGPAGSGKSTAAFMAAAALGRKYGYISLTPQTFESRLFGFHDAHGRYVRTEFRDCYEKGGLFCIDEMDNGSGNLYTALNGALENNICAFPDKQVKRHPDFVVVGTGNTSGSGPNPMFPTRRPFDKAFAERFTYIEWSYDVNLERAVAMSINPSIAPIWHEYCLKLREYTTLHMPMVLVSPRAVFKGCKYMRDGLLPSMVMMNGIIFKGYERDQVTKILAANPYPQAELDAAFIEYKKNNVPKARKTVRVERRK